MKLYSIVNVTRTCKRKFESSSNIESSSSIDLSKEQKKPCIYRHDIPMTADSERIQKEVTTVIEKIEERKKIREGKISKKKEKKEKEK